MRVLDYLINAYVILIIVRVFLSWGFLPQTSPVARWIKRLTEPVLAPVRRLFLPSSLRWGVDFSPVFIILLFELARRILWVLAIRL